MKKQLHFLFFIFSTVLFFASCTKKVTPTTATQDTLSVYRQKFTYKREKLDENHKGIDIVITEKSDTSWSPNADITSLVNKLLDFIPVVYKPEFEKKDVYGYRVQIYRGKNRSEAEKARKVSFRLFPRHRPYLTHKTPTYRVQVGDFINEMECVPIYRVLRKKFPTALIVPCIVNVIIERDER